MSVFNPEMREFSESGFEKKKFSPEAEARVLKALDDGRDSFPDLLQCPNKACRNMLSVTMRESDALLHCANCGWEHVVKLRTETEK